MLLEKIRQIDRHLSSVNDLLSVGDMIRIGPNQIAQVAGAIFNTLIDTPGYQMGTATFEKKGDGTEEHSHPGVKQFIVQAKGKSAGFFADGGYRVLDVGECCIIKPDETHRFVALTDDCIQLWICVPAETGYKIEASEGEADVGDFKRRTDGDDRSAG